MWKFFKLFFVVLVLLGYSSSQTIVLDFSTNINLANVNDNNYMTTTLDQKLVVDLDIGSSHQKIPLTIKTDQSPTFLVSYHVNDNDIKIKYDETKSSESFNYMQNTPVTQLFEYDFNSGYLVNDSINFNSSLIYKNFTYMFATELFIQIKNISGEIGLSKKRKDKNPYYFPERSRFLDQLKENKLINNKIFGIVYDTEYEGRLILGGYLHQVDDLYNENEMITNLIYDNNKGDNTGKWTIDFDVKGVAGADNTSVYLEENTYGVIMYELGLIVGSRPFRENFVINYFKNKNCVESLVSSKPFSFYQYTCDNENQFEDFPNLYFSSPGKYSFNFTKQELFKKLDGKYVFQVVFEVIDLETKYWRLGQTFFRKYNVFFDVKESDSYFSYYPVKKSPKDKKIRITWQAVLIIIMSIVLAALIGILIYFIVNWEKKKRNKKANELSDDEFDYTPKQNEETKENLIINN